MTLEAFKNRNSFITVKSGQKLERVQVCYLSDEIELSHPHPDYFHFPFFFQICLNDVS